MEDMFGALHGVVDDLWPPKGVQCQDGEGRMYRKREGKEKHEENKAIEAQVHRHETRTKATPSTNNNNHKPQ